VFTLSSISLVKTISGNRNFFSMKHIYSSYCRRKINC